LFTGGFEFVFILFIAFLLFGPKKLPEIARVLGKGLGELRRASAELRNSLEDEIRNLDRETRADRDLSSALPAHTREHRGSVLDIKSTLEEELRNLDRELTAAPKELPAAVTDNGHDHRDAAHPEPETRS
jgi:TatA/E family protein of Tat protein translocase